MSAKEIIMNMVEGLKNPLVKIDMVSYGHICDDSNICYGCAATASIARLKGSIEVGKDYLIDDLNLVWIEKTLSLELSKFVINFEYAIDHLRTGNVDGYNNIAIDYGFALIVFKKTKTFNTLPVLNTDTYLDNLEPYIKLANKQK